MSSAPPAFSTYETKTGINWKYAGQGTHRLVQSFYPGQANAIRCQPHDSSAPRIQYTDLWHR
jgi:hypothetical protein